MTATEPITDDLPMWTLGDRLAKSREHAGLEQADMAERLGVSAAAVSTWETDRRRPRDLLAVVRRWSEETRVAEGWILGLDKRSRCFSPLHLVPPLDPDNPLEPDPDDRSHDEPPHLLLVPTC
jgi:transcriptional regulator with XRE-family HTH domain